MKTTPSTILLKKVVHRNEVQLVLLFEYNQLIINAIRKINGFTWSKTLRGWYISFSPEHVVLVKDQLSELAKITLDKTVLSTLNVKEPCEKRVISEENKQIIRLFVKYLEGKRYSESAVKTYFKVIADFINYIKSKPLVELTNRDVEQFIEDVFVPKKMSISSQRQLISAIKLFKAFYPECTINEVKLTRPSKHKILPTVI